ncbi:YlzJ-like protein [Paenibacillus sp. UNCCL117]|uniref:YlzJ-like family protein n=1 Tax=unclassified Paenibacillus TaxID=185978 RepID=UPI0008837D7A|nr:MULTISPECIES: YlzJ-like family protein [unclassified Paenibacillus]SDC88178.1 YlzJ-like protein [Paenibacillus sp. cl123]SFW28246.1 YlzJ-like protein [Paenibacillus sp. UNCCL117]
MIHYTVLPMEAVREGIDSPPPSSHLQTMEISLGGVTMQVQPLNASQAAIVRLISCDLQDYLNPRLAPGQIIEFQPVIVS